MVIDWKKIKHFKPSEFSEPNKMEPLLIHCLDRLREIVKQPIIVHSSFRAGDTGTHGRGEAVDIHIKGLNVVDQFLIAEKTRLFSGIGVYPFWNNPGLHLDVRELKLNQAAARWLRDERGIYLAITAETLRKAL